MGLLVARYSAQASGEAGVTAMLRPAGIIVLASSITLGAANIAICCAFAASNSR